MKSLLASLVLLCAASTARADVAPCGRCTSSGARPASSTVVGAWVIAAGAGALVLKARRRRR